ncbi:hypothetical protein [Shinella sp.]|uniref:hypothetical protein n=1 Tax=Shinella sp. TaxID=1870904 RepID=UPI0029A39B32|nr:hypothetical protein [Shinella sp.]MDX3976565.1 hypothetical protein [Shinella sp.]
MNENPLIDVSRLRVLERDRDRASGSAKAAYERVKSDNERIMVLEAELKRVRKTLSDGPFTPAVQGGFHDPRPRREVMEGFFEKERRLLKEIADLQRRCDAGSTLADEEMARFSEIGELFEKCKKFVREVTANG